MLAKPRPLCACGCGEPVARPASVYRQGHNPQPERWKTWQCVTARGKTRWYVTARDGARYVWARVVMWDDIGREPTAAEVVHHIDGDSENDDISNLRLYASHAEHMAAEYRDERLTIDLSLIHI